MYVIRTKEMDTNSFEGGKYGPSTVSIILDQSPPGGGPKLHRHPYDESWVVMEGHVRVWIGDECGEAGEGDIVTTPPNTAHKFQNVGDSPLRLVCIHSSPWFKTEWLE